MNNDISTTSQIIDQFINKDNRENNEKKTIFTDRILKGDFNEEMYTFIHTVEGAIEEELIFVVHGVGQNTEKLNNILNIKIKEMIRSIYASKSCFNKQIHIRVIDWKTNLQERVGNIFDTLLDRDNNSSKFPKTFINQVPVDGLLYLNSNEKYIIINDIVRQMNLYQQLVIKHRPLFKGNVSIISHSLGACMMYEILTNMGNLKKQKPSEDANDTEANKKKKFHMREIELLNDKEFNIYNSKCNFNQNEKKEINYEIFIPKRQQRLDILKRIEENNQEKRKSLDLNSNFLIPNKELQNNLIEPNLSFIDESIFIKDKIVSKNPKIDPMEFLVNQFFMLGSPLSLFMTVERGKDACLEEMETVKDFHNLMHPHDPLSYRIEPLIEGFPNSSSSFMLPHWENDGIKGKFWQNFIRIVCCTGIRKEEHEEYINHDKKIGRKRYDFMVQESPTEKAFNIIGFLFSHQAYWNNHDIFYFILKMIHWQGYHSPVEEEI